MDKTQKQQEIHRNFSLKMEKLETQHDALQNKQNHLLETRDEFMEFRNELQILLDDIKMQSGETHANWLYEYEQELSNECRKMEMEYENENDMIEKERHRLYATEDTYYKEKIQQLLLLDKE